MRAHDTRRGDKGMSRSSRFFPRSNTRAFFFSFITLVAAVPSFSFGANTLPVAIPIDIVFSIDSSTSMGPPPPGVDPKFHEFYNNDPESLRIQAAKLFMSNLDPSLHWVGVVSWDARKGGFPGIDFSFGPTDDYAQIRSLLDKIDNRGGGTDLGLGLGAALYLLENSERKRSKKVVLFLTDGIGGFDDRFLDKAKALNATVYTVGLSVPSQAKQILERIAIETGGTYFPAPTAEALQSIFDAIFQQVTEVFLDLQPESSDLIARAGESTVVKVHLNDVSGLSVVALEPIKVSLKTSQGQLAKNEITIPKGEGSASVRLVAVDQPRLAVVSAATDGLSAKTSVAFVRREDAGMPAAKPVDFDLIIDQPGVAVGRQMIIKTILRDQAGNPVPADKDYPLTFRIDPITLKVEQRPQTTGRPDFPLRPFFLRRALAATEASSAECPNGGLVEWTRALGHLLINGLLRKEEVVFECRVRFLEPAVFTVSLEIRALSTEQKSEVGAAAIPGRPENLAIRVSRDQIPADGKAETEIQVILISRNSLPVYLRDVREHEVALDSTLGGTLKPPETKLVTSGGNTVSEKIILTASTTHGVALVKALATDLYGQRRVKFTFVSPSWWLLVVAGIGGIIGGILQRYKKLAGASGHEPRYSDMIHPLLIINLIVSVTFYAAISYSAYFVANPFYRHALFAGLTGTVAGYVGLPMMDRIVGIMDKILEKFGAKKSDVS